MKIKSLLSTLLLSFSVCCLAQELIVKESKCVSGDCTNGYGRYEFSTGEHYEGEWKNNKRNGQGTNVYSTGTKKTGIWKDDIYIGESTPTQSAVNNIASAPITNETFGYNQISGEYEIKDASGNVTKHSKTGGQYDPAEGLSVAFLRLEDDWEGGYYYEYGFIDSQNKVVIPFKLNDAENFFNGIALVNTWDKHYELINKTGKPINAFVADIAFSMGDNYIVAKQNNQFNLFDRMGKFLSTSKYEDIDNTNTDMVRVKYNNKYGYTDQDLNELIPMIYFNAEPYEDGFARVSSGYYQWGVIDPTGKVIIPLKYQYIESFHEGLAAFQQDEFWGYMDTTGKIVIPIKYFYANNFNDGRADVSFVDNVIFYINKRGERIK